MPALRAKVVVYGPARPPFFKAATREEAVKDARFVPGDVEGFSEGAYDELEGDPTLKRHEGRWD